MIIYPKDRRGSESAEDFGDKDTEREKKRSVAIFNGIEGELRLQRKSGRGFEDIYDYRRTLTRGKEELLNEIIRNSVNR